MPALPDEVHYRLLKALSAKPSLSQREVAVQLGVSLGKVNYCLKALMARGLIKASNFKNSKNRIAYLYVLTPRGLDERARMTRRFLQAKMHEYETLVGQIAELRHEAERESAPLSQVAQDTTSPSGGP
jgi:EPS-associated MarR family transcriptional regulator